MTWTAHEVDDAASVPMPPDDVAICPYCGQEHAYEAASATGEVAGVACCGEVHCLTRSAYKRQFPSDYAALYGENDDCF